VDEARTMTTEPVEATAVEGADPATAARKSEHLRLALEDRMQLERRFFDRWRFEHVALPEISWDDLDTSVRFLGRGLRAPFLVSCMTGGTAEAGEVNRRLAEAAEECGIALGVGSQRAAIEDGSRAHTFRGREQAPSVPLLANLGAVQLNYGFGIDECREAVAMIEADALVFHLNVLQEAIQPEGQRNFRRLLPRISEIAARIEVPVVAKEIGCGISGATARKLKEAGVEVIDVAGTGGTSWARIEASRADAVPLGELFAGWGIPTPRSIREVAALEGVTVIGSGGIRSGLDAAKALAMGADLVGMASPFLEPAMESAEAVVEKVERTVRELKIAMLCVGARTVPELRQATLVREGR